MAIAAEALGPRLRRARRVGALDWPVPSSAEMEEGALPSVDDVVGAVAKVVA
jgi:pyruvate/2-oxoglutarate/acetoin dehydrogenase E1 component